MADDQVKYSDLIVDDGAIDALDKRLDDIKRKMAEVKGEAATLTAETRNLSTATREQQQATTAHAAAAENLRQKMKGLTDEQKQLEAERRKYAKLTEQEANRVKTMAGVYKMYADAVREGTDAQMKALPSVDIQNKSYNELYQTYNALKDALNHMTVAERENTTAGKSMVNQAKEIRDTLNNLQQATGNYTLNVGNYMSALNGLQFQTQQVLREIPSAQNLSQFFLAISNNIPMFADALARYNQGLPEIKTKLAAVTAEIARQNAAMAAMNVQSAEYAAAQARLNELQRQQQQLQGASVSGWRAILKAVGSWQTLLIAGLLLLRKIPDIIKWIKERWDRWVNGVKEVRNEVDGLTASIRLQADAIKKYASTAAQLDLIIAKMSEINQESEQWATGVNMINSLIGESKAKADDNLATLKEITDEYKKQAKQIAINNVLGEMYEQNIRNEMLRTQGYNIYGKYASQGKGVDEMADAAAQMLGIALDSKEHKELKKLYQDQADAVWDWNRAVKGNLDEIRKTQIRQTTDAAGNKVMNFVTENDTEVSKRVQKAKRDAEQAITNFFNKRLEIYSEEELNKLAEQNFELVDPLKTPTTPKGPKDKEPKEQSLTDRYWEAEKALLEEQYDGYELERQLAKLNRDKARDEQINWYVDQQLALEENLKNGFITQEQYDNAILELDRQNAALRVGITNQYNADIAKINKKEADEKKKAEEQAAKEAEQNAKDNAKKLLDAEAQNWEKRRTEMVEQGKTRKEMLEAEFAAEIVRLNIMKDLNRDVNGEKMSDEQRQKVEEWIRLLKQLQAAGNFRGIKLGSIFGKGASGLGGEKNKSGNYSNIMDVLFPDMSKDQQSALNSVFDQAKEALNSWMDARKAAADQAKELADDEVSAAENALNREIELRNQGYANNVALRERELADAKEKQKQAVEEQKKIAQQQILLDAALQTSSLITATANIIKQFPNPLVWGPMLATMWGSFAFAKIKAYQASTKSIQFREGGVMLLEGGSHESGHDVNLGIGPDGSNLRAEGGEYFAVINKRNSRKYGSEIPAVVNALNSGMFEDRYIKTSDAVGMMGNVGLMGNVGEAVDLSAVESGVGELVKQGESRWTVEGEYRVERYKNRVRRVKIG